MPKLLPMMLFRGFHVHALFADTSENENVLKIREASVAKLTILLDAIERTIISVSTRGSGTFLATSR